MSSAQCLGRGLGVSILQLIGLICIVMIMLYLRAIIYAHTFRRYFPFKKICLVRSMDKTPLYRVVPCSNIKTGEKAHIFTLGELLDRRWRVWWCTE